MTAYRICLKERLDQHWSNWLGGLTIIHEANGETVLAGEVVTRQHFMDYSARYATCT